MAVTELKYRYQMYQRLHANIPNIYAEARKVADDIGFAKELVRVGRSLRRTSDKKE